MFPKKYHLWTPFLTKCSECDLSTSRHLSHARHARVVRVGKSPKVRRKMLNIAHTLYRLNCAVQDITVLQGTENLSFRVPHGSKSRIRRLWISQCAWIVAPIQKGCHVSYVMCSKSPVTFQQPEPQTLPHANSPTMRSRMVYKHPTINF